MTVNLAVLLNKLITLGYKSTFYLLLTFGGSLRRSPESDVKYNIPRSHITITKTIKALLFLMIMMLLGMIFFRV